VPRDPQQPFVLPDGAVEVILARHGSVEHQTFDSSGRSDEVIGGHSDPDLTELGRRQAVALAARLRAVPARGLFVTPLRRTQQTAAPLAAELGIEPCVEPDLREVYLGDWEGRLGHHAERETIIREVFALGRWDAIPNAEPMEQFSQRVHDGLERIADAGSGGSGGSGTGGSGGTVVAVVHGGVVAEACRQVTGSRPFAFLNTENGSITRLVRLAGGRWELHGFNDVAHLVGIAVLA
jgi:2,3-bisphosphoglycerate-dependent phosphoglycerate mutase